MKWLMLILLFFPYPIKREYVSFNLKPSIYEERIKVIIAPPYVMNKIDTSIDFSIYQGLTFINDGYITVWLPSNNEPYEVTTHELFHATHFIMDWVGIPLQENTSEAYAYLMGYLSKEFYGKYR